LIDLFDSQNVHPVVPRTRVLRQSGRACEM